MILFLIFCFAVHMSLLVFVFYRKLRFEIREAERGLFRGMKNSFPDQAMIQKEFDARLREAGWNYQKHSDQPVYYVSCIDDRLEINRQGGCRFYAYIQIGFGELHEWEELQQQSGLMMFCSSRASTDLSLKRWEEYGFSREKRFLLLDVIGNRKGSANVSIKTFSFSIL